MAACFQVAMILWIKELPKYLYQPESNFRLKSRSLQDTITRTFAIFSGRLSA
jgi:hypothetical protein